MYLLIMIILYGSNGVHMRYHFYEYEESCHQAAEEFIAHGHKDYKLKAFCIKGDN